MKRFNLRTYALIINESDEILVSDEMRYGRAFTKFPGGGLEWGEGLADGLKREIQEELGVSAEVGELFYVNEFYQQSGFRENDQLISFYYRVTQIDVAAIPVTNHEVPLKEEGEKFRWIPILELSEEMMTFPVDKVVTRRLIVGSGKLKVEGEK